jgi:uncharacterized protein YerC
MSAALEMYVERAVECRQEAAKTNLQNVRERCLRSAEAWEAMAAKLRVAEVYRANEAARKAEQNAGPSWATQSWQSR